jgi:hypothetical protein
MKYVWGRLGIAVFIIVALAIWIAAIWFLVCAPGTRRPALIIKFPDSSHYRRGLLMEINLVPTPPPMMNLIVYQVFDDLAKLGCV